MKERPILFSSPMVRAILDSRKTQTRRAVKPQPIVHTNGSIEWHSPRYDNGDGVNYFHTFELQGLMKDWVKTCPYGVPGDRLWVRETFYCDYVFAGDHAKSCVGCVNCKHTDDDRIKQWREELYYRADVPSGKFEDAGYWSEPGSYWKPSIFMPRWASRITLEITDVRVQRLQEISEEDAKAEGCFGVSVHESYPFTCREDYQQLWNEINGKKAPWASNPWVWAVSFRRLP
jgi:hypothetical protein